MHAKSLGHILCHNIAEQHRRNSWAPITALDWRPTAPRPNKTRRSSAPAALLHALVELSNDVQRCGQVAAVQLSQLCL